LDGLGDTDRGDVFIGRVSRGQHPPDVGVICVDPSGQLGARHLGHQDLSEDDLGALLRQKLQRLGAAVDGQGTDTQATTWLTETVVHTLASRSRPSTPA